jgi:hypothetical protein
MWIWLDAGGFPEEAEQYWDNVANYHIFAKLEFAEKAPVIIHSTLFSSNRK